MFRILRFLGIANHGSCSIRSVSVKMKLFPGSYLPWLLRVGHFGNAPIFLHLPVFVYLPFFWYKSSFLVALWATALMISLILVHELGHALVCRLVGAETQLICVSLFFGICEYFNWEEEPDERDFILIAWGGVFAQLVVLLVSILGFALFADSSVFMPSYNRAEGMSFTHVTWLVLIGFNAGLILFNLAPIDPLDGVKAWEMHPWRVVRAMWYGWRVQRARKSSNK